MIEKTIARDAPGTPITALQIGMTAAAVGRGGLDRYFFSLTRALPAHSVRVRGLVVGDANDIEAGDDIRCFAAEKQSLLKRWSALRTAVDREIAQSDLIVSHFAPYAFPVLDTVRSRPLVIHFHGPWALEGAAEGAGKPAVLAKHLLERIVYARGNRFVVLSRAFASILERRYRIDPEAIRVVPGGVDIRRFQSTISRVDAREQLGWPAHRPTVVSVRRLVHAKGIENLIDAAVMLRRVIPDVIIHVAGTGPLAPELRRRVADLDLTDTVRFAGFVPEADLPTIYRAADLFVVPTIALEGFGLVVIEALACGTPVLVTPIAGLPEVVNDLDPGLILPGSDAQALANGIGDALRGRLPLPTSTECISYAERFDWPHIANHVAAVYREVV